MVADLLREHFWALWWLVLLITLLVCLAFERHR